MIGNLPGLKLAELGVGSIAEGCSTACTLFGKRIAFALPEQKTSGQGT